MDGSFINGWKHEKGKTVGIFVLDNGRNVANLRECYGVGLFYGDRLVAILSWTCTPSVYDLGGGNNNFNWGSGNGGSGGDNNTDDQGCSSSCQNSQSKASCFISFGEYFGSQYIEIKHVDTYLSARLTNCSEGLSDAKTFSVGDNVTIVDNDTELGVTGRTRLGPCKWLITYKSRPKITWQPTTVEFEATIAQYGISTTFNTNAKSRECGPYSIQMILGN